MALARIQAAIVKNLLEMERLTEAQYRTIVDTEEELSGEAVERLLGEEYKISQFQLLIAKGRAFDLPPINIRHCLVNENTFAKLDQDFCREHKVLPMGMAGNFLIVAVSNPFDLRVTNKIHDKTGMPVSVLLALESEIEGALENKDEPQAVGFGDVVEALGMDYEGEEDSEEDLSDEDSAPIIQLANRIIEEAYYSGGSDIHIEPFENETRVRVRVDGVLQNRLTIPPAALIRKQANKEQ